MKKFFKYIRSQPKSVRETYAFGFAASFTAVVFVIWLVANPGLGLDKSNVTVDSEKKTMPFSTFFKESKQHLGSVFSAFKTSTSTVTKDESLTTNSEDKFEMKLSEEDKQISRDKEALATSTETESESEREFTEVLIGTTTVSASTSNQ